MQLNSIQNKIDLLIKDGNDKISITKRNEIGALVSYSQALDLFDFLERPYNIQIHETNVKISMCWEILGNVKNALEYLNNAMSIIPNIPSLTLYKSILLQMLNLSDESQKYLLKFKQLGGNNIIHNYLYDTFRIIYYYILQYDEDILLREINDYFQKYKEVSNKLVVIYYIRAQMYAILANKFHKDEMRSAHYIEKYEEDIMKANHYQTSDANYLIQENITNENLGKIFLMVIPQMIDYKPKELVEYRKFCGGFGVFYLIFKAIKLFKIKIEKKKIKNYYLNQLKYYQKNNSSSNNIYIEPCNSEMNSNSINETKGNTHDDNSIKGSTNQMIKEKSKRIFRSIDDIKKEYQNSLRKLYKSVWVYNYNPRGSFSNEVNSTKNYPKNNYFIKNGYYLNSALKPILFKYLQQDEEYNKMIKEKNEIYKTTNPNNNSNQTATRKTPVKLSRTIRMKIKNAMCNNIHYKNKNNSITHKNDFLDKSGCFISNSNKKNIEDSYISNENTNNKSDNSKQRDNYAKLIPKSSKKELGSLQRSNLTHSSNTNDNNSKVSSKEHLIKITNIKHLNIHLTHSQNKEPKKRPSKERANHISTTIKNNIISSYSTKPNLLQYKQKTSLSKYLINSFSSKITNSKNNSQNKNHYITTSANKSDDSKNIMMNQRHPPLQNISSTLKTYAK